MKHDSRTTICSQKGFTMIEMIIVFMLIGILAVIAIPNFVQWRQRLEYRETARSIASVLRLAKSQAMGTNLEQQVVFNAATRQYGIQVGDRANNANFLGALTNVNTLLVSVATIPATVSPIQFLPTNGAAILPGGVNTIAIPVNDKSTNAPVFQVNVTSTGRIYITP
jgi:prepilin-type N-terminal cleavage/methylation domain-containing protein